IFSPKFVKFEEQKLTAMEKRVYNIIGTVLFATLISINFAMAGNGDGKKQARHGKPVIAATHFRPTGVVGIDNITGVNNGGSAGVDGKTVDERALDGNNSGNNTSGNSNENNNAAPGKADSDNNNGLGNDVKSTSNSVSDVNVFPNPAEAETNVVTVGEILMHTIEVFDLSGKMHRSIVVPNGTDRVKVELSGLPTGIYMVVVKAGEKTFVKKIHKL